MLKLRAIFCICKKKVAGGASEMEVEVPAGTTARRLLEILAEKHHPRLQQLLDDLATAVNEKYVAGDTELVDRDVIAVMPPISGG